MTNNYNFTLPDMGEGIAEAEILRWRVGVGELVAQNQPMLEIQTDKAVVEIPAPVAGQIGQIHVPEGQMARVGDLLVTITPAAAEPLPAAGGLAAGPGQRILAAPAVRKLAREMGIDLAEVAGSGPAGRVLPDDVRRFGEQTAPPPKIAASPPLVGQESSREEPLAGLRRRIAERMAEAWRTIPHVTIFEEVDASELVALRRQLSPQAQTQGVALSYLPFIIKAVVQTLRANPYFNASLDMAGQKIITHQHIHIGLATATDDGLLVPVIRHADRLTTLQLAAEITRLAEQARQRSLPPAELSGSTFSITNFGSFGSSQGTPIINPPEAAILGCGKIADKPVAVGQQVEVRPVLPLALSIDHRLLDGAAAAQFLNQLTGLLAAPSRLLLEMA
ncbi:MAG: Dihydrolipoyllysine-residue acetyltransferase component of pyruvate dehydrogenase complex [Anaerolineae bacterium]|nr:Dihydrolipoyllysine-residue acetyltransferase component of pyruvate dehydrogenase complex [Anaerolineae bacterium]